MFRKRAKGAQLENLQEVHKVYTYVTFMSQVARSNTALIPGGKKFTHQLEALAKLLLNERQATVARIFEGLGIENASIDIKSGKIKQQKNVSGNNQKTAKK